MDEDTLENGGLLKRKGSTYLLGCKRGQFGEV